MRIIHVLATLDPQSGGPAQACLDMARAVAARGHDVSIFATDFAADGQDGKTADLGAYRNLDIRLFPVQAPRLWKRSTGLRRALDAEMARYDVAHVHSLYLFHNWAALRACRRAGIPFIVRPHGLLDPYIHRRHRMRKLVMELAFQNAALREAGAVHYTAELERDISAPFACGSRGVVVPLGVDLPKPNPLQSRQELLAMFPRLAERTVMLFLGRLHAKKGLDLLIPALAQARQRHPRLHLLLAGPDDGALKPSQALIAQMGLGDHVTVAGMLEGAAKAAAFAGADFFVLPSYSENFAIAAVEAMSYGLPVIVSDQVNIHPDIAASGAGLVVSCNVAALTEALERMVDPAARAAMAASARPLVERQYSWPAIGRRLEELYVEVIGRRRAESSAPVMPGSEAQRSST